MRTLIGLCAMAGLVLGVGCASTTESGGTAAGVEVGDGAATAKPDGCKDGKSDCCPDPSACGDAAANTAPAPAPGGN